MVVDVVPLGSGLWGYRTTSAPLAKVPPKRPLVPARKPAGAASDLSRETAASEARALKGELHVALCQLAEVRMALADSERRRTAMEAELQSRSTRLDDCKQQLETKDGQLAELTEEVERLEAMNRRLEDKQSDIRRMASEVLNSKAAVREAEKLTHEHTVLKAQMSLLTPLVSAIEDLDRVLPTGPGGKTMRRRSSLTSTAVGGSGEEGATEAPVVDFLGACAVVKAAAEVLTVQAKGGVMPATPGHGLATPNTKVEDEESKEGTVL